MAIVPRFVETLGPVEGDDKSHLPPTLGRGLPFLWRPATRFVWGGGCPFSCKLGTPRLGKTRHPRDLRGEEGGWNGDPTYTANKHWVIVICKTMNMGSKWNNNTTLFDLCRMCTLPATEKFSKNRVFS